MRRIDLLVHGPHFLTMVGEGVGYRPDTAMAVDGGKIVAIGPQDEIRQEYSAERAIDASGHVVLPGFIDAHMHTALCVLRGLAQDTAYWMMYGLGPFSRQLDAAAGDAGTKLAFVEGIHAGTTTFGDYGANMDGVCRFIEQVGVRAQVTVTVREAVPRIYNPGELYEYDPDMGKRALAENTRIYECWHGQAGGRISVLFGPQGPDFLSLDLLRETQATARRLRTKMHMHTAQGDRETAQMLARYGARPVPWLKENGFLDETLLAVHLTDATDDEAAIVARSGASMVLCSGSIGIIDGIVPPLRAFQAAGGLAALGSDQAPGNNCHNIINEMKLTALFNKIRYADPELMPAWRVLRMATIDGARAVGLADRIGSLAEGKQADFIIIDLTRPPLAPLYTEPMRNIVPNLVYAARGDEVDTVAVAGRIVMENRRIVTVDETEIVADAQHHAERVGPAAASEFWRVKGTNAVFMKENKL